MVMMGMTMLPQTFPTILPASPTAYRSERSPGPVSGLALTRRPAAKAHKIAHYVLDSRDSFNDTPDFVFRNRLWQQPRQPHLSLLRLHAYIYISQPWIG